MNGRHKSKSSLTASFLAVIFLDWIEQSTKRERGEGTEGMTLRLRETVTKKLSTASRNFRLWLRLHILARSSRSIFRQLSAVSDGVEQLREIFSVFVHGRLNRNTWTGTPTSNVSGAPLSVTVMLNGVLDVFTYWASTS